MSMSGLDKTWASFASFALALMLGACAHVGEQNANNNDAAASNQTAANSTPMQPATQMVAQPVPPVMYKVRRGDSLVRIARSHDVTVAQIVAWNHLKPHARLRAGQSLKVSSPDAVKMVAVPVTSSSASNGSTSSVNANAGNTSGAMVSSATGSDSNGSTGSNNNAQSTTASAAAPAPSAAEAREVNAEVSRHAKGVSLIWPAQGSVVEAFQPGETRGIEIGGKPGDPIRAAADGKVMYAGTGLNEYGSLIIVQHNKDFLTAYAHNRKLLVKTGDIVRKGQQIAEMGSENNSRVSVLFELRHDGKPIDPMPFLPHQRS
ncbi:peptidoglycan DD-metalloendopeptidase family protein [Paraburkholderia diazotrophica]|uniref:Lipoprotein NlpD n=1 Tax=Paraburkholderia diazotrophica TaxID=667676 RepID=A0A1H7EEG6_9BURK|nr:peptidoglycan DD-metalloendopeptidase family protein [Paraburkholderia diazotrophica]SEK12034.1 lipoprotein NlpD [Paraburkholderia diazotrophica]